MTTLGQAYVQIMPSSKGISGSIQKTLNPESLAAGKSAGSNIASAMAESLGKAGKSLTKSITLPALGAVTAVTGIVTALGWGRLTGLDSARAKLQGLGYDAEAVERISGSVNESIQGTVTTMAEGVSIAAGALAAGVKEGEELERFIKLVGDAAVGANRPVNDMAQIFNRVQGSGKLMTQELNMIEDGMPGFAMAMSESLGVPQAEFRKMVTEGEISSTQFLNVMDSFAGDMSEAYANSWAGMVANTKSNIGIIGERILGGVFEQSKESIADFLAYLRSDDLRAWAAQTGQVIGESFSNMIDSIRNAIEWWTNLDGDTKKLILTITGIVVAIGPVLMVLGKLISVITAVVGVIASITPPVLIAIGVISGLVAIGVSLYKNWDTIKAKAIEVFSHFTPLLEVVRGAFQNLMDSVGPIMESLKTLWESLIPLLEKIGVIVGAVVAVAFGVLIGVFNGVVAAIGPIINALINLVDFAVNMVNVIVALFTGDFAGAWDFFKDAAQSSVDFFINIFTGLIDFVLGFVDAIIGFFHGLYMTLVGNSIIPDMVNGIVDWFKNMFQWVIDIVTSIVEGITTAFTKIYETVSNYIEMVSEIIKSVWGYIKDTFTNTLSFLKALVTGDFKGMRDAIKKQMDNAKKLIQNIWKSIDKFLSKTLGGIWNTVKNIFGDIFETISSVLGSIKETISNIWNGIKDTISSVVGNIKDTVSNIFNSLSGIVKGAFTKVKDTVKNGITGAYDVVTGMASKFFDAGKNIATSIADGIKGAIGKVTDAIGNVTQKIRDFLPFSPPKTGPLIDIMDVEWGETIGGGIEKGEGVIAKAMEDVLAFDLTKKATFSSPQRYDSSGRDITINNSFTSKEMTPSEISRKQRQQLEQLALGW